MAFSLCVTKSLSSPLALGFRARWENPETSHLKIFHLLMCAQILPPHGPHAQAPGTGTWTGVLGPLFSGQAASGREQPALHPAIQQSGHSRLASRLPVCHHGRADWTARQGEHYAGAEGPEIHERVRGD